MLPPGPRTPALWQTYRFVVQPAAYAKKIHAKYGDAVRHASVFGDGLSVFEAGLAREVFAAPPETFATVGIVEEIFGAAAVIAVSGDRHRKLRKLLNPPFHGAQVKSFLAAMQRAVRTRADDLGSAVGGVVAMTEIAQAIALDVIIETVFGAAPLDHATARAVLRESIHAFVPSLLAGPIVYHSWFPPWRRFVAARAAFDRWANAVIAERRRLGGGNDVLGVLLAARYDDGAPLDDGEIRDQLRTLLLAGHETSAVAMAWCVYYLLENPEALHRLRAEIDALGPDPAPEAIVKLKWLDAVVSETLRIEPIVTDVVRVCRRPFRIGRWTVPENQFVAVMIVSILHDPRIFPEPARFRPDRFLENQFAASEFLPFGGGSRRCLGAAFAQAELAIAVAEIVSRWDLARADDVPERAVRRNLTMGPANGVRVRVVGRRDRAPAA